MSAAGAVVGTWVGAVVTFYFTRSQVSTAHDAGAKDATEALEQTQGAIARLQLALLKEQEIAERLVQELKDLGR